MALILVWTSFFLSLAAAQLTFDSSTASSSNRVVGLTFRDRLFVPYGPDLTTSPPQNSTNGEVWKGYGFGMNAVEQFAYDPVQGYIYAQSGNEPYVTVVDYSSITAEGLPAVTPYSIDLTAYDSAISDVAVCGKYLMLVARDANLVLHYETVQRATPAIPKLLREIDAGTRPDNLRFNNDCTILAVANENEGSSTAAGAVHLITDFDSNGAPTVRQVPFTEFDDAYLLARDVHMPLTLNAMIYWDDNSNIAGDVDWSTIRAVYNPSLFMHAEYLQFSPDSSTLLVNLQSNSALARVNVATATLVAVDGYELKSWAETGIDILDDDGCSQFITHDNLYSMRSPDGIATVQYNDELYVITANEGSDFEYNAYEEKTSTGELLTGTTMGQTGFVADATLFSTTNSSLGALAQFNADCEMNGLAWCSSDLSITMGSSAVDYSNTSAPVLQRMVTFGGRGITIYRVPPLSSPDGRIELIWDSGSEFEQKGCEAFPWAHNGIQDDGYAPVGGAYYQLSDEDTQQELNEANDPSFDGCEDAGNGQPGACPLSETIDKQSPEDGPAAESVVVAIACGRLLAISCGENNGNCFLYDISDIGSPVLVQVLNLSPASETKSPGVAYDDRTLGDVDAETIRYVPAKESPTGLDGMIFGGAHSGTLSFYEFQCQEEVPPVKTVFVGSDGAAPEGNDTDNSADEESEDGLSAGGKAGIAIGVLAGVGLLIALLMSSSKHRKEAAASGMDVETTKPEQDLS